MIVILCRVKAKSSAGRAACNRDLPFEGPAKTCHFWDAGPVTWVLNPAGQPGFSACFGWETVKSFFPSCTPRVSAFAGTSLTALSTGILLVPLRSEQTWLSQSELSVLEGPQLSEFLLHPWQCPFCMLMWAQVVSSLWPWERYSAPLY